MSEQEELPLVVALTVVVQGCKNQYEQVLKRTGAHPAYREAIPVVERFLDELTNAPNQGVPS